jgi:hypothetical protein
MKLLIERMDQIETLVENDASGKRTYITGPFLQAVDKNRNNRVYPRQVLEESVDQYKTDYVNERRALGELDHPPRPNVVTSEAAILIESLDWNKNLVMGKAQVLDTPKGQIVKALLEAKFNLGVSSRGLGTITEKNGTSYVNKYLLSAIDAVDRPSAQVAYVNMVNESMEAEWINENGIWVEKKVLNIKMLENNIDRLIELRKKQNTK